MNLLPLVALLLLCTALILSVFQRRKAWRDADAPWPFYAKKPLASPEQVLYQRLVHTLPGHIILFQVPVSGVLGVKRGFDFERWSQRIRRLQYDFVVCAKDATVLAAIELDDTPGSDIARNSADWIKERASAAAGIRLLRWQAKALPDPAAILELFGELELPLAEDVALSANQSWWPPLSSSRRHAPDA